MLRVYSISFEYVLICIYKLLKQLLLLAPSNLKSQISSSWMMSSAHVNPNPPKTLPNPTMHHVCVCSHLTPTPFLQPHSLSNYTILHHASFEFSFARSHTRINVNFLHSAQISVQLNKEIYEFSQTRRYMRGMSEPE